MRAVIAVVVLATAAGCSAPSVPPAPPMSSARPPGAPAPAVVGPADWPTYHHDNARTGLAGQLAPLGTLHRAWQARLDGAVYGQPLVIGEKVIAATEHDTVYALAAADGHVLWSASLGEPVPGSDLPCGNIDPLGITGTPAYDQDSGLVFVVAETRGGRHTLAGVDLAGGAVVLRRPLPPPRGEEIAHQQRAALTVLDGWVYVAYGGLFGDCGDYVGSVLAAPTTGTGPLRSYAVPTPREGGIWAPGGAAVHHGRLLYTVGNGASTQAYDHSDSVLALTPQLSLADSFSPAQWGADNADDLDLGSMSPVVLGERVLAVGKRGDGYLLDATRLGGISGQLTSDPLCQAFGAGAVAGSTVYLPCTDSTRAVDVDSAGGLRLRWRAPVPADGSPVLGGGAVWVTDTDHGVLYALDPATGVPRQRIGVGPLPHFASPTLAGTHAYLGTTTGIVAITVQ
ncbi:MAG: PQQ-binding-like beta-propeller repeat protein [Pseudonocardiales bacterium]|nr:PQQ-binding-like beta-propeller repeat protein [Pseudonocardiales bacterium]MBV9029772.1 PQQ-binding-like beta-propeller repeat protein [Pseudonocardiales bacterium]MBW0011020.1 PQQ-binding-like beta-propeller repeat protein [Pseudonocardiales bacterium]